MKDKAYMNLNVSCTCGTTVKIQFEKEIHHRDKNIKHITKVCPKCLRNIDFMIKIDYAIMPTEEDVKVMFDSLPNVIGAEIKIGELCKHNDIILKCVKAKDARCYCNECYFFDNTKESCDDVLCSSEVRSDHTNIILKRLKMKGY